jgi:hypothetical protein
MAAIVGTVLSVNVRAADTLSKDLRPSIEVALDGIVGDR